MPGSVASGTPCIRHYSVVNNKHLLLQEDHIPSLTIVQFDYNNTFFLSTAKSLLVKLLIQNAETEINSCQPPTLERPLYSIEFSGEQRFEIKTFSLFLPRERRWHVSQELTTVVGYKPKNAFPNYYSSEQKICLRLYWNTTDDTWLKSFFIRKCITICARGLETILLGIGFAL